MARRILKDTNEVTLYFGQSRRKCALLEGTSLREDSRRAEKVILILAGRWEGWYFVEASGWLEKNTIPA